jgi:hypothetical protein
MASSWERGRLHGIAKNGSNCTRPVTHPHPLRMYARLPHIAARVAAETPTPSMPAVQHRMNSMVHSTFCLLGALQHQGCLVAVCISSTPLSQLGQHADARHASSPYRAHTPRPVARAAAFVHKGPGRRHTPLVLSPRCPLAAPYSPAAQRSALRASAAPHGMVAVQPMPPQSTAKTLIPMRFFRLQVLTPKYYCSTLCQNVGLGKFAYRTGMRARRGPPERSGKPAGVPLDAMRGVGAASAHQPALRPSCSERGGVIGRAERG